MSVGPIRGIAPTNIKTLPPQSPSAEESNKRKAPLGYLSGVLCLKVPIRFYFTKIIFFASEKLPDCSL